MKPAAFRYERPLHVHEAIELLSDDTVDARVLAGGQSLVPLMAMRLSRPDVIIDLNAIDDLRGIRVDGDTLRIGAMTRQAEAEHDPLVAAHVPVLATILGRVGHVATRNRGTIGGSVAHADPAAELVAFAVLVDATCVLQGPNGVRRVRAADFFETYFTTAINPDEILVELTIPLPGMPRQFAIEEFARRAGDFAIAGVIAMFDEVDSTVTDPRLVAFAAGPTPIRGDAAEELLRDRVLTTALAAAGAALADACSPADDIHGSAGYRRELVATLTERALLSASRGSRS
ncbi:MAG: xanthine dehydrogenase family protein subunit M [Acidimicrobiia bacterium]